jgi:hypothetical protein
MDLLERRLGDICAAAAEVIDAGLGAAGEGTGNGAR